MAMAIALALEYGASFFFWGRAFVKAMALAIAGGMAMGRAIAMD